MIRGTVELNLDALVSIQIQGPSGVETVEAVVDTGFSNWLSLPASVVRTLGLEKTHSSLATLADGSVVTVDVYVAEVEWHDEWKMVRVDEANTDPLIGMRLLRGSELRVAVTEGGAVSIQPLPDDA